ncbi:MAG: FAD:protein FMN transferase [Minicystis sp.]
MSTTFRAMSTDVTVLSPGLDRAAADEVAARVRADFAASERRFSRFRADSELSRLNREGGLFIVSTALFTALQRARGYFDLTDGLFDPTIGAALEALGYNRSFAPGALDRAAVAPAPRAATFAEVTLDEATRAVTLPPGVRLDLGGLIKGFTVDRAARRLRGTGAVDAGGDAVLRGDGPDGDGWLVDVEDPADPARVVATLRARDRAVATSAANRRRWRAGGRVQHHLVDPRTRRPAETDLAQASVLAPSAELADVLAKTAFLLGARAARRFLERLSRIGAVLVRRDGAIEIIGDVEVVDDA